MNRIDPSTNAMSGGCWRSIGVWGDQSCGELKTQTHCNNCPVFVESGRQLFQRPSPEDYIDEWTRLLASERFEKRKALQSAMVFRIGPDWLAMGATFFVEVRERKPIHRVPHVPNPAFLGLANIGGSLQLCVSLARVLGLVREAEARGSSEDASATPRIVVIEKDRERWACPVDEVEGLIRYAPEEVKQPPVTVAKAARAYTRGILASGERGVALLDEELLFYNLKNHLT